MVQNHTLTISDTDKLSKNSCNMECCAQHEDKFKYTAGELRLIKKILKTDTHKSKLFFFAPDLEIWKRVLSRSALIVFNL